MLLDSVQVLHGGAAGNAVLFKQQLRHSVAVKYFVLQLRPSLHYTTLLPARQGYAVQFAPHKARILCCRSWGRSWRCVTVLPALLHRADLVLALCCRS